MRIVIIGGGVVGLSVAYHLGRAGGADVELFERNRLTSGTSWHAAGIVGPLRSTPGMTRLALYGTELFGELESETGQVTGYRQTGGFWLAQSEARLYELRRTATMGAALGLDTEIVTPGDLIRAAPFLRVDDLCGGLWVAQDGQINPVDLCMAYARGAKAAGVHIHEGIGVGEVLRAGDRVVGAVLSDGRRVSCEAVVNCAGVWSRDLAASAGVAIPLQAVQHMYLVTEPWDGLPDPTPVVRDLDARIYIKGDAGRLVLGGFESNAKIWSPSSVEPEAAFLTFDADWDHFAPFMDAGLNRVPALQDLGIQHFMNGPESFTPDTRQLMGEAPELRGYFVSAGFNSIGIMSSAGVGRVLAEWILSGEPPQDLWEVDIARMEPQAAAPRFLRERMREAVSDQFDMHWPLKQPEFGRFVRRSPLHRSLSLAGAVFGHAAGWERPYWFARTEQERSLPTTYGPQDWWSVVRREGGELESGVVLFDLTPFTKIDVCGTDALALLQRLCANDVDVEPGRTIYTPMLNRSGGIEADVTVTRYTQDWFRIVSGAPTRRKDLAWVRRSIDADMRIGVFDASSAEVVIAVMGPMSRPLLETLSDCDLSTGAFPFGTSRRIDLAMTHVRATRVSFVGELGWELYVPVEFAEHVYEALLEAGRQFDLGHAGQLCMDGCRLEKGFRHWGHDLGSDLTPLQAGLGFTVSWTKGDFLGREALIRQREHGLDKRLLLFELIEGVDGPPLLLHDEVIRCDGRIVGFTTSGGLGPRTGRSLAFGLLHCERGTSLGALLKRDYVIDVAGERFQARALRRPPYDPEGHRSRC